MFEKRNKNKQQKKNNKKFLHFFCFLFSFSKIFSEIYLLLTNNIGLTSQYQYLTKKMHTKYTKLSKMERCTVWWKGKTQKTE